MGVRGPKKWKQQNLNLKKYLVLVWAAEKVCGGFTANFFFVWGGGVGWGGVFNSLILISNFSPHKFCEKSGQPNLLLSPSKSSRLFACLHQQTQQQLQLLQLLHFSSPLTSCLRSSPPASSFGGCSSLPTSCLSDSTPSSASGLGVGRLMSERRQSLRRAWSNGSCRVSRVFLESLDAQIAKSQLQRFQIAVKSRDLKSQIAPQNHSQIASKCVENEPGNRNCNRNDFKFGIPAISDRQRVGLEVASALGI